MEQSSNDSPLETDELDEETTFPPELPPVLNRPPPMVGDTVAAGVAPLLEPLLESEEEDEDPTRLLDPRRPP